MKCFDKSIKYNPDFLNAYHNKGNTLFELEKYEEALDCFVSAMNLDPENKYFLMMTGNIYDKLIRYLQFCREN
ncbi:MAG: tetratricopeptide repeat protein [Promethearchaeota archaeon]|nr:MAG: tetratricopeptide repeat protein [Candidatus Lokiarchaeota archaeon]